MNRIVHLVDPTSGMDVLDTIALTVHGVPGQHQVLIFGHNGWLGAAIEAGIEKNIITWNRTLARWDPTMGRALTQWVKVNNPTHIHAWGYWSMAAASRLRSFSGGRLAFLQTSPDAAQLRQLRGNLRRARWLFITPWQSTHAALLAAGLPHNNVACVSPAGWLAPVVKALPENLRRSLGMQAREGPAVFLGGWSEESIRHDLAIWAVGIVAESNPDLWALIRNDDVPRKEAVNPYAGYQSFARTLKDPQLIVVAPSRYTWGQLAAAADIFLFAPKRAAGVSSLLAAMALGKPIVSAKTDQVCELLENGTSALLAPPDDPRELAARLNALVENPALREKLGAGAKAAFAQLARPELFCGQLDSIHGQLLQDPGLTQSIVIPERNSTV
ncbi:MAG: glycosyltransferase family 4 protein [Phycisphaerae bacterium]